MLRLNPLGPIFEKELRATSRRKRTFALRVGYLGVLLLLLLFGYATSSHSGQMTVTQRVQQQNELGRIFFAVFSMFGVISMGVIGPVLTSTAIGSERLHKTLPVLLMTPITSMQIVTGKLFSRLLVALTLVGLSLPVLALVRLLGGVELHEMFGVLSICAATALSTAALGLLLSTFFNRAFVVILLSYAIMFVCYVFIPFAGSIFVGRAGGRGFIYLITSVNPAFNAMSVVMPGNIGLGVVPQWWIGVLVQLVAAVVLTILSAVLVRRLQRHEGAGGAPASEPVSAIDDASDRRASAPNHSDISRVYDNPVLWREIGRPILMRRWYGWAMVIAVVALLLASYGVFGWHSVLGDHEVQMAYSVIFNGLIWLATAVLAATAVAQEHESDTWTLLTVTPLSGAQIIWGKVLGMCRRMMWPMVLVAAHFGMFALAGVISWAAWVWVLWIIISFNSVWIATGVLLSVLVRRVTFAVICNVLIAVAFYAVIPLLLLIVGEAAGYSDNLIESSGAWIPYIYLPAGVDAFSPDFRAGERAWLPYDEFGTCAGLAWLGLGVGMIHVILAVGIVGLAIWRFDRMVGRAPQIEPYQPPPHADHVFTAAASG